LRPARGAIALLPETGFLCQISAKMPSLSQKPGFFLRAISWGFRNRVSLSNFGQDAKLIAETRFQACEHVGAIACGLRLARGAIAWVLRNRVSLSNLGQDAKIVGITRFLSSHAVSMNLETIFLVCFQLTLAISRGFEPSVFRG